MKYDYLIVGSGLFGATVAHEMTKKGKRCLVIDKRKNIGGNVYTEQVEGINVHRYGAHIFHTSDENVWKYVNDLVPFNDFINSPIADYHGERYHLPFNMNTFTELWKDVKTPEQAKAKIAEQVEKSGIKDPKNLEEKAITLVGTDIYEKLVKGYTEKQWGRPCSALPAFIITRLPLRFTFNNNYFNDIYQGIPIGGYTKLVEKLLDGSEVLLNTDYKEFIAKNGEVAPVTIYTGTIDGFFDYRLGKLEYRTLRFETEILDTPDFQHNAVVNYTDRETPFTRIIEHKHFENAVSPKTVVTREYPAEYTFGDEPYYPINDEKNGSLYKQYKELADKTTNVIFGGRLGGYAYYDMDKTIIKALELCEKL